MSPTSLDGFFDKIERVSYKVKLLIGFVIIVAVCLAFYFLVYASQSNRIAQLNQEIKTLDMKLVSLKATRQKIEDIEKRNMELDEELKQLSVLLPKQKEVPEVLQKISGAGRQAGLEFLLFEPTPEITMEHVVEIPISIEVEGTFFDTASFFYRLSRLSRVVNISKFEMKEPLPGKGGFIVTTNLTAKTFRELTEAEKKALEAKKLEQEKKDSKTSKTGKKAIKKK